MHLGDADAQRRGPPNGRRRGKRSDSLRRPTMVSSLQARDPSSPRFFFFFVFEIHTRFYSVFLFRVQKKCFHHRVIHGSQRVKGNVAFGSGACDKKDDSRCRGALCVCSRLLQRELRFHVWRAVFVGIFGPSPYKFKQFL
jgi:hypothetical protein